MATSSTEIAEPEVTNENPSSYRSLIVGPKYGKLIPNRIFVGGIRGDTTENDLQRVFSAYGNVLSTKVVFDNAGISKGYGFVTFETEQEVQRLQRIGESIILKERKLNIAPAFKKQHLVTNDAIFYTPLPRTTFGQRGINRLVAPALVPLPELYNFNQPARPFQPVYQYYGVPVDAPHFWQ